MGIYSRHVFPRLCDWAMSDTRMGKLRSEALADVGGQVLEIGFGTGLNLAHYPEHVRRITTVDRNPGMNKLARRRIAEGGIEVDQRAPGGEKLPFHDVVSTWTLCSIPEVERALSEIIRVLRPGGRFVFLEHGLGSDPGVQRWQRRLNPIRQVLGDAGQNPVVHGTQRIDIMRWQSTQSQFNGGHQCWKPNATCWADRFPQTLHPC